MKPPTCKLCGAEHWSTQPHQRTKAAPPGSPPRRLSKEGAAGTKAKKKPRRATGAKSATTGMAGE